jgi:hypothetical protein
MKAGRWRLPLDSPGRAHIRARAFQPTVPPRTLGNVAWRLPLDGITVFSRTRPPVMIVPTHVDHVTWFGAGEPLATAMFD